MAENVTANRQASPASEARRVYGAGCLPIILAWFLLDLIGKAIIWGVASLFGVQIAPACERTMDLKKTQGLKDHLYYQERKNLAKSEVLVNWDGGRYWTRTSDPYRVKVVL